MVRESSYSKEMSGDDDSVMEVSGVAFDWVLYLDLREFGVYLEDDVLTSFSFSADGAFPSWLLLLLLLLLLLEPEGVNRE